MCGIAGIITQAPTTPAEIAGVKSANSHLAHRGPDGSGEFTDNHVMLAMRRLSIIDLDGGWQPLYNEDHSLALVANGEIYNFVELRASLESRGHRFNTHSDCETILHLYEEHDLAFVEHLRGMYAFALWDTKRKRLVIGRDRMGEKPLYIYETKGRVLFASEMKALLASGLVPFELDPASINLYFHYQYVPEPRTPLKNVRKLEAASLLIVDVEPWKVEERRYWRMEDAPPLEGDPATLIREQLETVSEIVIRSDVPVGIALSGGLDSSAIAALAARKYPGTMHAFSVGYPGGLENDERQDARALADHLGMPFHDVELSTSEMISFFPELVYLRDDPIADIAGFGYYSVNKLAREHNVPVILQGQGGDELFWGYPWVRDAARQTARKLLLNERNSVSALPHYLELSLPTGVSRYEFWQWARQGGGLRPAWQSFQRDRATPANQFVFYDSTSEFLLAANRMAGLYGPRFREQLNGASAVSVFTYEEPTTNTEVAITKLICDTYLRENGVAQGDRLSMASSIELRLPFLDHRLIDTVIGLRKAHSDIDEPPKARLHAAIKDLLPEWVVKRPKRGFTPPVRDWHNTLLKTYGDSLKDGFLTSHGVLNEASAQRLTTAIMPFDELAPISLRALVLEHWCRRMHADSKNHN
ncbi:MAG TPA: asparagine synthase (glutamine-hydrolyzing) [Pyrinomonadaceae bacterium]|nr:asparagine synthase (glutamine-hydrolyzing) [Pyrinomonadaceae bacterium]